MLIGDNSCEWAAWFKAHNKNYQAKPGDFNYVAWKIAHTELLNRLFQEAKRPGGRLYREKQAHFRLYGSNGAVLSGTPDLVVVSGMEGTVYDAKTGQPSLADAVQVMVYMWALPLALPDFRGVTFAGTIVYPAQRSHIPASAIDDKFKQSLKSLIRRLAATQPAAKVASRQECRFCDLTEADCPERTSFIAPRSDDKAIELAF